MNYAKFFEFRGRLFLAMAETFSEWSRRLRGQASRDIGRSLKPLDLLAEQDLWGRGK